MEHGRWCIWIGCIHLLIVIGDTQGASTVYARYGETATLSWDLPSTGLETFRVSVREYHSTYIFRGVFRVTNYNTVTVMNNISTRKMEFVGNITPSGTGVFSFMLHDVYWFDAGHYRCYRTSFNSGADYVHGCGQRLVVLDIQQPYIGALHTALMDRSVTLSCYSIYGTYVEDVNASIKWRRNGLLLDESSEYNITHENLAVAWLRCHRGNLTVSDVSKRKGDNFSCQAVLGPMVSGWSEVYALVKQSGSYENYTVVHEGHSALIMLKMPLAYNHFRVLGPRNPLLFEVFPPWVDIRYTYRTRVNITKVTTSADSFIVQFWLHNARSEDAGKYLYCDLWTRNPIPECQHMLYVGKPAHPNISVIVNTANIVLTCETNSSIVPLDHDIRMIYTWQRNGQEVENGTRFHASGQILAVTDVKKEDLGNYSCQATEKGLASNWSDTVDLQMLTKLQVGELIVNGTVHTTVNENQVVVFRCMVEGPLPSVSLIRDNSSAAVNMSRTQQNVYEHVMVVRKCSQLGVYSCRASNVAGASEDEQRTVVLEGMPRKQTSHVFVTIGKTPSMVISITLCSYPGPSKPKLGFTQSGNMRDITDIKNYHLETKNIKHNVFEYSFIIHNITDADFGVYKFSVEYNHSSADFIIPASRITDIPERSLHLVVSCSVAAIVIVLAVIAGVILSRLNQLRDYWNLRFRSYITPMQNMTEHIDDREYAEIDDADLPGRGAGNIVQPGVNVPVDNNIPPACGARHRREGQQMEDEDDEYEEVRPLDATNREEHPTEQGRTADMQQPDKDIKEDVKDEMVMTLPGSHAHSEHRIAVVDWSAEGREPGNMAAAIINQFAETSFMTQEPDETDTDKLPAAGGMYSGTGGMTAIKAEEDDPLVEGREDFSESEPLDLPYNRYESLMPHQPVDTYTSLDNDDGIAHT